MSEKVPDEKWRNTVAPLRLPHEPLGEDRFGVYVYDFSPSNRTLLFSAPDRRQLHSWKIRLPYHPDLYIVRIEELRAEPGPFGHYLTYKDTEPILHTWTPEWTLDRQLGQ